MARETKGVVPTEAKIKRLQQSYEKMEQEVATLRGQNEKVKRHIASMNRRIEEAIRALIAVHGVDAAPLIIAALCDEDVNSAPPLRLRK